MNSFSLVSPRNDFRLCARRSVTQGGAVAPHVCSGAPLRREGRERGTRVGCRARMHLLCQQAAALVGDQAVLGENEVELRHDCRVATSTGAQVSGCAAQARRAAQVSGCAASALAPRHRSAAGSVGARVLSCRGRVAQAVARAAAARHPCRAAPRFWKGQSRRRYPRERSARAKTTKRSSPSTHGPGPEAQEAIPPTDQAETGTTAARGSRPTRARAPSAAPAGNAACPRPPPAWPTGRQAHCQLPRW